MYVFTTSLKIISVGIKKILMPTVNYLVYASSPSTPFPSTTIGPCCLSPRISTFPFSTPSKKTAFKFSYFGEGELIVIL